VQQSHWVHGYCGVNCVASALPAGLGGQVRRQPLSGSEWQPRSLAYRHGGPCAGCRVHAGTSCIQFVPRLIHHAGCVSQFSCRAGRAVVCVYCTADWDSTGQNSTVEQKLPGFVGYSWVTCGHSICGVFGTSDDVCAYACRLGCFLKACVTISASLGGALWLAQLLGWELHSTRVWSPSSSCCWGDMHVCPLIPDHLM
jgi:hypothetical protein